MNLADWAHLLLYHLSISLLAVGGAITLVPDLHRFLATDQRWLTDVQFTQSVMLAQAAPGPNVLFVALVGWNVGHNAAGPQAGTLLTTLLATAGALICTLGVLAPSSLLTVWATRWCQRHRERPEAFGHGRSGHVQATVADEEHIVDVDAAPRSRQGQEHGEVPEQNLQQRRNVAEGFHIHGCQFADHPVR